MWALARDPCQAGQPTSVLDIYALPTEAAPGTPACVIYYRITYEQVELIALKLATSANEL